MVLDHFGLRAVVRAKVAEDVGADDTQLEVVRAADPVDNALHTVLHHAELVAADRRQVAQHVEIHVFLRVVVDERGRGLDRGLARS